MEIRDSRGELAAFDKEGKEKNHAEIYYLKNDQRLSSVESHQLDLKGQFGDLKVKVEKYIEEIKEQYSSLDRKFEISLNKQGILINYMHDACTGLTEIAGVKKDIKENIIPAIEKNTIFISNFKFSMVFLSTLIGIGLAIWGTYLAMT